MKLSYREKIGLLVLTIVVLIIIFIAWPIKTLRTNIKAHQDQKETIQMDYDKKQREIAQIPTIENNISKIYDETKGLSEKFAPHMENIDFGKYFEELLNKEPYKKAGKNTLEITEGMKIADAATDVIPFYYYEPNVITYPILEYADVNGNLLETTDKALYDKAVNALYIQDLESQEVEVRTIDIAMKFTKESLLALEDELKKSGTGIRITKVSINDYTFGSIADVPANPQSPTQSQPQGEKDYSEGTVSFTFYTMQQIQKPDFND